MKKHILFIAVVILSYSSAFSQACLPEGITFTSQEKIDNFQANYPGCTEIEGDVVIGIDSWYFPTTDITNLNGLNMIHSIGGDLRIYKNDSLITLTGLENLQTVGGSLAIGDYIWNGFATAEPVGNYSLNSLTALGGLDSIGGDLFFIKNHLLSDLSGLDNLTYFEGHLCIEYNDALTGLSGMENITYVTDLYIWENNSMTSLSGLNNLTSINGDLVIGSNDTLISLTGLGSLNSISMNLFLGGNWYSGSAGNPLLNNLSDLENLTSIGGVLSINNNNSLTSLSGLENLTSIIEALWITENCALTSLSGLEGVMLIDGGLKIYGNSSLSSCNALWLCDYLSNPNGCIEIYDNAPGCGSVIELANSCGGDVPCLPYGDYIFFSQDDIDNFQSAFPNCTALNGNARISGSDITDLAGLGELTSIGGNLLINSNDSLTSLTGIENLTSILGSLSVTGNALTNLSGLEGLVTIGGDLGIGVGGFGNPALTCLAGLENLSSILCNLYINNNEALTSLSDLENLVTIGGRLYIQNNDALTNLVGLENIDANSISSLRIMYNESLSTCAVQSICDYLAAPNGTVYIQYNSPGCNSQEEVEEACETLGVGQLPVVSSQSSVNCYPNPTGGSFNLQFTIFDLQSVLLKFYDAMGQEVAVVMDGMLPAGEHSIEWNMGALPAGIYYFRLQTDNRLSTGKLIKL